MIKCRKCSELRDPSFFLRKKKNPRRADNKCVFCKLRTAEIEILRLREQKESKAERVIWTNAELARLIKSHGMEFASKGDRQHYIGKPWRHCLAKLRAIGLMQAYNPAAVREYTDDQLAQMYYLRNVAGLSCSQTSKIMGLISANAVIGAYERHIKGREDFFKGKWSPPPDFVPPPPSKYYKPKRNRITFGTYANRKWNPHGRKKTGDRDHEGNQADG